MSEAATPAVAAGNRVSTTRIVGGAGVALAASVILQNAMFVGGVARLLGLGDGTGAPTYGDPLGVVLAYHAAIIRGTDVDKPRNLAKSVTVE